MSSIYRKANGRWYISYTHEGKRTRKPLTAPGHQFATKNKAVAMMLQRQFDAKFNQINPDDTFEELKEQFLYTLQIKAKHRQYLQNKRLFERFITEQHISDITHLTRREIELWIQKYQHLHIATLRGYIGIVNMFWTFLYERELIGPPPRIRLSKPTKQLPRHFTESERIRLMELARENNCFLEVFIPMYTGIRLSELRMLNWEDFHWDTRLLMIDLTKSKYPRAVPLNRLVIDTLRPMAEKGPVFPSKYKCHDRRMINTFLNVLKPLTKAMPEAFTDGMSVRAVGRKYHLFRHDFAVRAAKAGVPIPELKNWLGHSSITTTMIYAQYSPEKYSEYIERI